MLLQQLTVGLWLVPPLLLCGGLRVAFGRDPACRMVGGAMFAKVLWPSGA